MGRNIQLSEDTVADIYKLILALVDYELDRDTDAILRRIEAALQAKMDAIAKRRAYTEYKTALNDEVRENARQKYLKLVNMEEDWRWGEKQNENIVIIKSESL